MPESAAESRSPYFEIDHPWVSHRHLPIYEWTFPAEASNEELSSFIRAREDWAKQGAVPRCLGRRVVESHEGERGAAQTVRRAPEAIRGARRAHGTPARRSSCPEPGFVAWSRPCFGFRLRSSRIRRSRGAPTPSDGRNCSSMPRSQSARVHHERKRADHDLVHRGPDLRYGADPRIRAGGPRVRRRRIHEEPLRALRVGPMGGEPQPAARLVPDGASRDAQLPVLLLPGAESIRNRPPVLLVRLGRALRQPGFPVSVSHPKPQRRDRVIQHHDCA